MILAILAFLWGIFCLVVAAELVSNYKYFLSALFCIIGGPLTWLISILVGVISLAFHVGQKLSN